MMSTAAIWRESTRGVRSPWPIIRCQARAYWYQQRPKAANPRLRRSVS